jgi:hypothetical protein
MLYVWSNATEKKKKKKKKNLDAGPPRHRQQVELRARAAQAREPGRPGLGAMYFKGRIVVFRVLL